MMESGAFAKQEGLVQIYRKKKVNKGSEYLLSFSLSLLLLSVIVVRLSQKSTTTKQDTNLWNITNTIVNECWVLILLWFYTLSQMHIKNVLMSVWIECSVTEGNSPFSISGKHEFKWYSANGSTLKLLRRKYP